MEHDKHPEPPRILIREREFTATDRLIRLTMVVLIFALGMVAGFGIFKIHDKKQKPGPFTAEWREDEILIRLRDAPVALLRDQADYYKFALAGEKSPWHRAYVSGSIEENELVALNWFQPFGKERVLRSWWVDGKKHVSTEKWVGEDLIWDDVVLDENYRHATSAPPPKLVQGQVAHETEDPFPSGNPAKEPAFYRLTPAAIDALVSGRDFEEVASRIAGTPENTSAVMEARAAAIESLQDIEKSHSRLIAARKGTYSEIRPNRSDGRLWLAEVEADLRKIFPDDRAAIFTRMIAAENNGHNASDYRQEIRTISAPEHMGGKVIERKLFDESGKLIHTSYDMGPRNRIRWGHSVVFDE